MGVTWQSQLLLTAKNIEISFKSSLVSDKEIDGICEETVIILVY